MSANPLLLPESTFEIGLSYYRKREFAEAARVLAEAVHENPSDVEALHVLSLCQAELGDLQSAVIGLAEVVRIQPKNAEAWANYGANLRDFGNPSQAMEAQLTATRLDPRNANAWNNLSTLYLDSGDREKAEPCLLKALECCPKHAAAMANLSRVQFEKGGIGAARNSAKAAIALDSASAESHNGLSFVQSASGNVQETIKSLQRAVDCQPNSDLYWNNLLLKMLSSDRVDSREVLGKSLQWGAKYADIQPLCQRQPQAIKRIGFVSGDLRKHPVGFFLEPLLEPLSQFSDIFCYPTVDTYDEVSASLMSKCKGWRSISGLPTLEACQVILHDEIDVLIDLSGHTGHNRLDVFARCPAPFQLSWLGYSSTTGLPQMDGILADSVLIPSEFESLYSERVLRLPNSFLCFSPTIKKKFSPPPSPITFGVLNNPGKFSEGCFQAWSKILNGVPGSKLVIKYHNLHDPWVRRQILGRFEDLGIPSDRVSILAFTDEETHHAILSGLHLALDTFPYTGATTTLDCLLAGVPVISTMSDRYASRMSASLLCAIGRQETVCNSVDEYCSKAIELATDSSKLSKAREGITEALLNSPICDAESFADGFYKTLLTLL